MQRKPISKLAQPSKKSTLTSPKTGVKAPSGKSGIKAPLAKSGATVAKATTSKYVSPRTLTKDWKELQKNVLICTGSYSQAHKRFKGYNQQSAAVCIVACAFSDIKPLNTWTKEVLDEILEIGTNLYLKSRQISDNKCLEHMAPPEIYKYFFLDNSKISIRVSADVMTARITSDSTILQKIEDMLNQFFATNTSGIFACQNTYLAIWKFDKFFVIFDSTEHNLQGGKWVGLPGLGFCYALRATNTKYVAEVIAKNCPLKAINKFTIYPCGLEKIITVNTKPPDTLAEVQHPPLETDKTVTKATLVIPSARPAKKTMSATAKPSSQTALTEPQKNGSAGQLQGMQPKRSISKSRIPPEKPRLQSVTNFAQIYDGNVGILRASTHQRDPKFTRYMGAQSLGNAVAALTMLRQFKSKQWIRTILDDILKLGEVIHHDSKSLRPGQVCNKVTLKEIDYTPKIEKVGALGRLISNDEKILSLDQALKNVLIDTDCCILIGPNTVAIWKEDKRYYMFDPEERDSSGNLVTEGEPGVACVTWYTHLTDLVTKYLNNVPKNAHKDRFMLSKITIKDYVPLAEDWYKFKALTFNKWILRGNFSQQDRRFPPESRNAQCTANATMALAYKELKEEKDWDTSTVDQVLISGDEFYRGCVQCLEEAGKFKHKYLMVDELKRDFDVENKRVNLEIDDCLINGIINARSDTGIPNLKRGFEDFFLESEAGIVTANLQSMAVWRKDNTYYYYDSHSRNEKGVVCGFGTACILRMVTIEDLTNALMTNLGPDRQNLYNISRVVVKLIDLTEEGVVKPPLHFYEALNDLVAILRSNTSENDPKFTINAGKQAVPVCLAALAFNTLTPSFDWTKDDIDQILVIGDKLYAESMEANYGDDVLEEVNVDEISTANVKKQLQLGTNLLEMETEDFSTGNFEENLEEAIVSLNQKVAEEGNDAFHSILESQDMTVSMWRDDNLIYLFDPRPRDERGQIYGKDDWSAKIVVVEEPEEVEEAEPNTDEGEREGEAEGRFEKREDEGDEGRDELAGGDNLGEQATDLLETDTYEPQFDDNDEFGEEEGQEGEEEEDVPPPPVEKKGSAFWRMKEHEGKACVLRFSRVEDLIGHLLENSPPNRRQDIQYSLKLVKISNTPVLREIYDPEIEDKKDEFAGDWNEFKEVDYGKWILRSVRNLRDGLFPVCNRGKQAIPMCLVSLAFASLYELSKFTPTVVDSILAYGDRLYTLVRNFRSKKLKSDKELNLTEEEIASMLKTTEFKIADFPKKMCMGERLAIWEAQFEVIAGDTSSKMPETVPNVASGLSTFFEENNFGILQCRNYPLALWKHEDIFYMFDPHATGPSGSKSPIGVSCITRFKEVEDLAQIYTNNLPRLGNNFFEIHAFTFTKDKCVRERQPEIKEEKPPKLGGFTAVTAGKNILRGDVKLDCTKFDRGVHIHSAAIAFVALALSLNKDPDTWTRIIINEILTVGEELYNGSIDKLGVKFNPWADRLDVCRVNTDFNIGRLKVNCAIRFSEQKGIVDVKNSNIPNLRQGLERFFEENSHGIIVADKLILPVWEQAKGEEVNIYIFDPNARGATGLPGQGGVACAMKFCNAKLAFDHIMACMMDVDKTKTEFSIIPIEIVVGTTRTKRKVCKASLQKQPEVSKKLQAPSIKKPLLALPMTSTSKKLPLSAQVETVIVSSTSKKPQSTSGLKPLKTLPPAKVAVMMKKPPSPALVIAKPVTCPDKAACMEEKRLQRKMAEEERVREEARRLALLGRNEMYHINNNEAIVRGLRCMAKDRELPVNIVAFVFMKVATDLNKWTYKQIELVLETGYQLYVDSFNAYKPETTKLTIQHLLRRVLLKNVDVKVDIKKPIPGASFTRENVLTHLSNFFTLSNFCIFCYQDLLVSIYFKSGYYYLFDPYSRDLNGNKTEKGCAMLMCFGALEGLVEKLVRNLQGPEDEHPTRYALIVVAIQNVQPLNK